MFLFIYICQLLTMYYTYFINNRFNYLCFAKRVLISDIFIYLKCIFFRQGYSVQKYEDIVKKCRNILYLALYLKHQRFSFACVLLPYAIIMRQKLLSIIVVTIVPNMSIHIAYFLLQYHKRRYPHSS